MKSRVKVCRLRSILAALVPVALAGCDLAGTAASSAAAGASQAREAQQAKTTEAKVKQQVDDALRTADEQRRAAEEASQ